ncbi:MAG: hypothetical protein II229_00510, partial [Clostridia bacterium]|nr:hypothetical protein [Clostridia bacterium]
MSSFDDMSEQGLRLQLQNTINSLAKDVNDYQMDLEDIVDHITATLPLLEYLCKTALNVSHLGHPKSMQELVKAAEDITLQHLGGALLGEMQMRHASLGPMDDLGMNQEEERRNAEMQFQNAYDKSISDSHFVPMEDEPVGEKKEFIPTGEYDSVGEDTMDETIGDAMGYDENVIDADAQDDYLDDNDE